MVLVYNGTELACQAVRRAQGDCMRFMTDEECRSWAVSMDIALQAGGTPVLPVPGWHRVTRIIPVSHSKLTWFCRLLERSLQPRTACLLWVTDWETWEQNLHLYYRLRQSYGENRLLHEAPGHYFLDYEGPDLVSFLEVAIICGWDAHLLPVTGYARAFVSHDEYVDFAADPSCQVIAEDFARELEPSPTTDTT
jgi:hypothetical protein